MNKNTTDNEIDVSEIAELLWSKRFVILFVVIFSVPLSMLYIKQSKPLYISQTVIQLSKAKSSSNYGALNSLVNTGIFQGLLGFSGSSNANEHLSKIMSRDFLYSFINQTEELKSLLSKYCPYRPPSFFSITAFFDFWGIAEVPKPSELQKNELMIECVRNKLTIKNYEHEGIETSAVSIQVESPSPFFSAKLANTLVEYFFLSEKIEKEKNFEKINRYFSETISKSQVKLNEAQQQLREFYLSNASLLSSVKSLTLSPSLSNPNTSMVRESPFMKTIQDKILNLGQTETLENDVKFALNALKSIKTKNVNEVLDIVEQNKKQGVLARSFISEIVNLSSNVVDAEASAKSVKSLLKKEINRLEIQVANFETQKSQREIQTADLMQLEKQFQILELDVQKQAYIFEGLKDQLTVKVFESGLDKLKENKLLSTAVPPIYTSSPNKKLILALGILLSFFGITSFLILNQIKTKKIFSASQIKKLKSIEDVFQTSLNANHFFGKKNKYLDVDHKFFLNMADVGKFGCVIDISGESFTRSKISKEFVFELSKLISKNGRKVLCVNGINRESKSLFMSSEHSLQKNTSNKLYSEIEVTFLDNLENEVFEENIFEQTERFKKFDKVLIPFDSSVNSLTKFGVMQKADFYVFIGQKGYFNLQDINRYIDGFDALKSKCQGFFLIS